MLFGIISSLDSQNINLMFPLKIGMIWMISKVLWKHNFHQTGVAVLFSFFTSILSEILILSILTFCYPMSWNSHLGYLILINLCIAIFAIFLFHFLSLAKLFQRGLEYFQEKKWFLLVMIGILNLSIVQFYLIHKKISFLSLAFLFVSCIILIEYMKEKMESKKLADEYQKLIIDVETFEYMLSQQAKKNKEYHNQLSFLRKMLQESGGEELSYIDHLLNEKDNSLNAYLLEQIQKLSKKGLMGLFYYKISVLQEKQVQTTISIDFQRNDKILELLQDKAIRELSLCLGYMFDYSTYLLEKGHIKQVSINAYHDHKNIYFAFTHPIGENNLPYIKSNEIALILKEITHHKKDYNRREEIINGVYTQTLILHI